MSDEPKMSSMATHVQQPAIPTKDPRSASTSGCHTRKLGTNLVVCLEGRTCPFSVPYGYLAFCKDPSRNP